LKESNGEVVLAKGPRVRIIIRANRKTKDAFMISFLI